MRSKWSVLALLVSIGALNYADRTAVASLFPLLRSDLGLTDVGMALTGSLFLWSYAAGSPFAGRLADRYDRRRLVLVSLAAWSSATALSGLATEAWQLQVMRLLLGLSECFYLPAALALLADYHGHDSRGTAMGIHSAGLGIGMVIGATGAGYLGEVYGWRSAFLALGGAGIGLAAIASRLLPGSPPPAGTARVSHWPAGGLFAVPLFRVVLAEAALIATGNWMFANWLPLYFSDVHGLGLAAAGFSGTFALKAGNTTGAAVGGLLSDRFAGDDTSRRLLLQGACYLIAAPLLLVFAGALPLGTVGVAIFLHGLIRSAGGANELPVLCDALPSGRRSTAIGIMNAMNTFTGGLAILVSGYLRTDFDLSAVFAASSLIVVCAGLVCLWGWRLCARGGTPVKA
jgi:predicted MFS family arabinose efflux permease